MSAGVHQVPRKITYRNTITDETGFIQHTFWQDLSFPENCVPDVIEDFYYPSHQATVFTIIIRKT